MSAGKPKVGAEVVEEQGGGKLQAKRAIDHGARWARYGASILLLIVVSFGSYFFIYVAGRSDRLDQYNLRLLSTAAQNVGDVLLGREEIARSAAKSVREPKREGSETAPDVYRKPSIEELEGKRALIPHVVRIKGVGELDVWPPEAANAKRREPEIAVKVFLADWTVDPELRFVFHGAEQETKPIEDDGPLVWSAKLRDLLEPTLPSELFDIVAVARGDRSVLLQKGRSKLHLSQVPSGVAVTQAKDPASGADPNLTSIREVEFAGQKYRMYVQPFQPPIQLLERGPTDACSWIAVEDDWLVVGLAPAASVRREALLIPPTIVIPVVGFLMLGVLILPYLRVRLIGPRESLRLADVLSLGVSVFLIASLVTTGLLYVHVRGQLSREQDERLEQLSEAIEGRMRAEFDALEDQLVQLSEKREPWNAARGNKPAERTDLLVDPEHASLRFPFFQMAVWLDSAGQQGPKWTVKQSTTAAVKVLDRPYFRRARDYELWPGAPAPKTTDENKPEFVPGRFVESIRSRTTGERLAQLSKRIEDPLPMRIEDLPEDDDEREIVATILSRLLSAIGPTLPPDHGFAVLDGDGTVLFHAEEERNLHENFLEEVEPREALEAALFGGEERSFGVEYRTRALRLHVAPMAGTPWTLAVFVDQDVLRTQRLEILTLSVVLFVTLLLVLLLVALGLHLTSRTIKPAGAARPTWFWPWKERRESYTRISVTMGAAILIWAVVMIVGMHVDVRYPAFQAVLALVSIWIELHRRSHLLPDQSIVVPHKKRIALRRSMTVDRAAGFVGIAAGALLALVDSEVRSVVWVGFIAVGLLVLVSRRASLFGAYVIALGLFIPEDLTWSALGIPSLAASVLFAFALSSSFASRARSRTVKTEKTSTSSTPDWVTEIRRLWREWAYLACGASVLIVVSVLPSITFFRAVYDEVGLLFTMREQLEFAEALSERSSEILARYDDIVTRKLGDSGVLVGESGRKVQELLPSSPPPEPSAESGHREPCPACRNVAEALDVYARIEQPPAEAATAVQGREGEHPAPKPPANDLWLEAIEVWNTRGARRESPCVACMEAAGVGSRPLRRANARRSAVPLLAAFRETLPSYNVLVRSVRELADRIPTPGTQESPARADGSGQGIRWVLDHDGGLSAWIDAYRRPIEIGLTSAMPRANALEPNIRSRGLPEDEAHIALRVASVPTQFAFGGLGQWLLTGGLALGAFVWLLRSIAERACLVHLRLPCVVALAGQRPLVGKREFLLRPDEEELKKAVGVNGCLRLDSARLRDEQVSALVFEARAAGIARIVVEGFEVGLREPAVALRKLELLEELVELEQKDVVICSEMEPLHFFTGLDFDSQVVDSTAELTRWAAVLKRFEKRRGDVGDLDVEKRRAETLDRIKPFQSEEDPATPHLVEECWPDPDLRRIAEKLAESGRCAKLDREQVVDVVLDHAEAYYRTVFGGCSREERVVLYRLAQDGFVNWHVDETLRRLIRRGLVRYEAGFPLMNESFRRFVLFVESPADVREYEIEGSAGIWSRLRAPIIASLGVLGVFLYFTQRQSFDQTIGLVAALATGWPAVVSLLARVSRQPKA